MCRVNSVIRSSEPGMFEGARKLYSDEKKGGGVGFGTRITYPVTVAYVTCEVLDIAFFVVGYIFLAVITGAGKLSCCICGRSICCFFSFATTCFLGHFVQLTDASKIQ